MDVVAQVLDQARQGDVEALTTLYQRFLPVIFGYIATRVPDRATAEDLTSEVFVQMVEGIHRLRAANEAGCAAWLLRIARVTVAGYYRKRARQPVPISLQHDAWEEAQRAPLVPQQQQAEADPVSWAEARDDWQVVVQAINQLTEEQRQVLVGRLILGYDVATVARLIGKRANAVKALQFRALQRLHRLLGTPGNTSRSEQKKEKVE